MDTTKAKGFRRYGWGLAGVGIVGLGQAYYAFHLDPSEVLVCGVGPLFPNFGAQVASCVLGATLALAGVLCPPKGLLSLVRAMLVGLMAALVSFEWGYLLSRFPVISDVSISLTFRPWTRILPWSSAVFIAVSLGFLIGQMPSRTPEFDRLVRLGRDILNRP